MLTGLFALIAAHQSTRFQLATKRRADALADASVTAQTLNRIATNNALIIVKLADALNRYSRSHAHATNYQRTVPFWQGSFLDNELKAQEPVANLFAATSRNFASLFAASKALAADSQSMKIQLQRKDPRWQTALQESSINEAFCAAIELLARKKSGDGLKAVQGLALTKVHFNRSGKRCSISIGVHTLFDPEFLFQRAQIPESMRFGIMLLQSNPPLETSVQNSNVPWSSNPLTGVHEWPTHVDLGKGQIRLMHPALKPQWKSQLAPLLEPKWVPVYVTNEVGG